MTKTNIIILGVLAVATALWLYSGCCYLVCPFRWLTGLQCPLCGMQRFLSAMLHLHPVEAISYNPWLIVLAPYSAVWLLASLSEKVSEYKVVRWCCSDRTVCAVLFLSVIWGIVRNVW